MTDPFYYEDDGFTLHFSDRVFYTQCGTNKKLSLFELLKRTTDISTEDFRRRGMSMDFIAQNGFARVVSRSSFRFHRLPERDEAIEIITREEKPEALQIIQSYEIKSESGESLISGESAWMIINSQTRRIVPTKNFTLRKAPEERLSHDCIPNGRIARPEHLKELATFKMQRSFLDGNGHVDNAWYATLIIDSLPEDFSKREPKDFRINYSKELFFNDTLVVSAAFDENKITLIGEKCTGENTKELSFESELYF